MGFAATHGAVRVPPTQKMGHRTAGEALQHKVSKLGVPPLPLLQELVGLASFCTDHLDDFVEDSVKLLLLVAMFMLFKHFLRRMKAGGWLMHAGLAGLGVVILFPAVDHVADLAGDQTQGIQNWIRLMLGHQPKHPQKEFTPADVPWVVQIADDYIEDGFKFVCISSHAWTAQLLSDALLPTLSSISGISDALANMIGTVVSIGGPASQYAACNEYGDQLGDVVQRWLNKLIKKEAKLERKALKKGKPVPAKSWWLGAWLG